MSAFGYKRTYRGSVLNVRFTPNSGHSRRRSYEIHGSSYDEANKMAIFYATITGTHVGEGGPVPPTNKQTVTDYVYALTMNDEGKVAKMYKVWNAPWTLKELGWM